MEQNINNQIPNSEGGVNAIVKLTREAAGVEILKVSTKGLGVGLPDEIPLLVDHRAGGQISVIKEKIEEYRINPKRRTGTAHIATLNSFIELVLRHKDEHSVIFADTTLPKPKLTALIDYHMKDGVPRHGSHRIEYDFPITEEWAMWLKFNAKLRPQLEFAQFLEDHIQEMASPTDEEIKLYEPLFREKFGTPSDIMTLSRGLEIHVNSKAKRQERLQTGEKAVEFTEEHMNGKGEKVEVPGLFIISVPTFLDSQPVRIPTRLRYRLSNADINWSYEMYKADWWMRESIKEDIKTVIAATELPVYEGSPEG